MTHCKDCGGAGRCGERTERCQWQRKRSERVAAVKISSVRRKAAQKFWAPQQDHRPLRNSLQGRMTLSARCGRFHVVCVGEGLSCPPSCQPTDGHCCARQSGHFLETGSLHPPLAALRRFPLPRATARVAPTKAFHGVRCGEESPSHGFAVPAPFRQGGRKDGGYGLPRAVTEAEEIRVSFRDQSADWSWESVMPLCKGRGERIATPVTSVTGSQ